MRDRLCESTSLLENWISRNNSILFRIEKFNGRSASWISRRVRTRWIACVRKLSRGNFPRKARARHTSTNVLNPSFSRHRSGKKRSMAGNTSIEGEYRCASRCLNCQLRLATNKSLSRYYTTGHGGSTKCENARGALVSVTFWREPRSREKLQNERARGETKVTSDSDFWFLSVLHVLPLGTIRPGRRQERAKSERYADVLPENTRLQGWGREGDQRVQGDR